MAVKLGAEDSGTGHRSVALVFTNTSGVSCSTSGYPSVTALTAAGTPSQARQTPHGYLGGLMSGDSPTVVLAPGRQASALFEASASGPSAGTACTPYTALDVSAPGDSASTRLSWSTDACADPQIHPLVPGTTGRSA